jgi:hypothetical protein
MEERRPNTHEKGNEIASARDCKSVTCFSERIDVIKMDPTNLKEKNYSAQLHSKERSKGIQTRSCSKKQKYASMLTITRIGMSCQNLLEFQVSDFAEHAKSLINSYCNAVL